MILQEKRKTLKSQRIAKAHVLQHMKRSTAIASFGGIPGDFHCDFLALQ